MQLSGVQAAAILLGLTVLGIAGLLNGLSNTQTATNSNRLTEIALSYGEAIANSVKSGAAATSDSETLTDNRLGPVAVTVTPGSSEITVTATAQGISRQVQVETR